MSKEELEKLEREKYVVERKLTAAKHKESKRSIASTWTALSRFRGLL